MTNYFLRNQFFSSQKAFFKLQPTLTAFSITPATAITTKFSLTKILKAKLAKITIRS